jgi:hypothetical protein
MEIELVGENKDEAIDDAFKVIEAAINTGHKFSNREKDLGIRLSIDALAPHERPWFFEIAQKINRIPLWQALWGQFRRCQEWGSAQAPMLDPGWANEESMDPNYGLGERPCEECGKVFKPRWQGERFCSNVCGVAEDKRKLEAVRAENRAQLSIGEAEPVEEERSAIVDNFYLEPFLPVNAAQDARSLRQQSRILPHELLTQRAKSGDDSETLDLGTDFAETEEK